MTIDSLNFCSMKLSLRGIPTSFAAGLLLASYPALAQRAPSTGSFELASTSYAETTSSSLPDSPGALVAGERESAGAEPAGARYDFGAPAPAIQPMASHTDKYIHPGQPVPSLSVKDKFELGVKDAVSPFSALGWLISAGYEQGTNGTPNYGTNAKAFSQRLGAAAARSASEGIFSDSVMDSVLREDPRYYRMGPGHNFFARVIYSGTRAIITRTDSGRTSPNFALLAGNLGGSYLTKAYYPPLNTSNTEVFKTFGGSIGGSALGFLVSEFIPGGFNLIHGSKKAAD